MSKRTNDQTCTRAKPLKKVNANQHQHNVKEHFANQVNSKEPAGSRLKENSSPLGFSKHYASTTEILYSSFAAEVYAPPHLSSQQLSRNVFKAECSNWQVRRSSTRKFDYDQLYAASERRYEKSSGSNRKWSKTKSKIKYLLDEDRTTYCHFQKKSSRKSAGREMHPDDDLSEESSGVN